MRTHRVLFAAVVAVAVLVSPVAGIQCSQSDDFCNGNAEDPITVTPKPVSPPPPVTTAPPKPATTAPTPAPKTTTETPPPTSSPAPTTETPTLTPTTTPEATTTSPSPSPTTADSTSPPPSASVTPSITSSNGAGGDSTPSTTTATTTTPSTTDSSSSPGTRSPDSSGSNPLNVTGGSTPSSSSNNTTGGGSGSGSPTQTNPENTGGSENSTMVIVGIAGGVVVFVIAVATLVACRRRQDDEPTDKLDEVLLSPRIGTQFAVTAPTRTDRNTTRTRTSNRGSLNSSGQNQTPQGGLWDDEVIVAARIPREKVVADALLSRGGYGEVYRGSYNGQVVAIKTLLPETRNNMKQISAFLAEVKLMASLEHPRIVLFIGVAWDSLKDLCVVSEYMEGGDLRSVLTRFEEKEHRPHGFDHDKVKIALHISHALTYLHSLQPVVLHRDLKSKNILLDGQLNAKLTDFGVSRERSDRTMTAGVGTSLWMAPEVMMGGRYDEKSDIFSFGVVLSELDSHSLPYSQVKESDSGRRIPDTAILQMVSAGKLRVGFSPNAHPAIVELANACVAVNPVDRPTAAEVAYMLHTLLRSY